MAEGTERLEGKTPAEIKEELSRFLRETVERDMRAKEQGTLRKVVEADQA